MQHLLLHHHLLQALHQKNQSGFKQLRKKEPFITTTKRPGPFIIWKKILFSLSVGGKGHS